MKCHRYRPLDGTLCKCPLASRFLARPPIPFSYSDHSCGGSQDAAVLKLQFVVCEVLHHQVFVWGGLSFGCANPAFKITVKGGRFPCTDHLKNSKGKRLEFEGKPFCSAKWLWKAALQNGFAPVTRKGTIQKRKPCSSWTLT